MANREIAHRIFASELNDTRFMHPSDDVRGEGGDDMTPRYGLTPLGALVNRLYVVGYVNGPVESSQDRNGKAFYKLRLNDGVSGERQNFFVYISSFQTQPQAMVPMIKPWSIVAISGKLRAFEPTGGDEYGEDEREGRRYLFSIRPDLLVMGDDDVYNRWLIDAAKGTLMRVRAMREVIAISESGGEPKVDDITVRGFPYFVAKGAVMAYQKYGPVEQRWYIKRAFDALSRVLYPEKFTSSPWGEYGVRDFSDLGSEGAVDTHGAVGIEGGGVAGGRVGQEGGLDGPLDAPTPAIRDSGQVDWAGGGGVGSGSMEEIKRAVMGIIGSGNLGEDGVGGAEKSTVMDTLVEKGFERGMVDRAIQELEDEGEIYRIEGERYYLGGE